MDKVFFIAAVLSMAGVVGSLFIGLFNMGGNTAKAHKTSHQMMRLRVLFQGLAIAFLFLAYLSRQ